MATNSSLIIVLFELVLYLTTATSDLLYSEFVPIAKEVEIAIKKMDLPKTMKDAFSNDYINVGGYSNDFIGLLDSYETMSCSPIRFNEKEKLLLTLSNGKDAMKYKVRAQLKYYRKMQEAQCTDYFILYYYLFNLYSNIQQIIQHVYNMIQMACLGKFVVFPWLLKLHINLLTPSDWKHEAWITQLMRYGLYDPEQYKKPLRELVSMCVKHKYLEKNSSKGFKKTFGELVIMCVNHNYLENDNSEGFFKKMSEHDKFNSQLHLQFNANISPLPFSFDYLYLSNIRQCEQLFVPITSAAIGWNRINDLFQNAIYKIDAHLATKNWKIDPFKNVRFQQMFLDIVKVKLYSFVKVGLVAYQRVDVSDYKYRLDIFYRLDYFLSMISDIVEFIDIGDKTLNEVLTLYSTRKKGKSNYEQNENLLNILTTEINDIVETFKIPEAVPVADISEDDLKTERAFILFLGHLEKAFLEFENFLKTTLDGFSLNVLLFFVNGINNTELAVFP